MVRRASGAMWADQRLRRVTAIASGVIAREGIETEQIATEGIATAAIGTVVPHVRRATIVAAGGIAIATPPRGRGTIAADGIAIAVRQDRRVTTAIAAVGNHATTGAIFGATRIVEADPLDGTWARRPARRETIVVAGGRRVATINSAGVGARGQTTAIGHHRLVRHSATSLARANRGGPSQAARENRGAQSLADRKSHGARNLVVRVNRGDRNPQGPADSARSRSGRDRPGPPDRRKKRRDDEE